MVELSKHSDQLCHSEARAVWAGGLAATGRAQLEALRPLLSGAAERDPTASARAGEPTACARRASSRCCCLT
eukprot:126964-Rhodomonas_salina.2